MGYEIKNICTLVPNPHHPEFYENPATEFYYFSLFITPRLQFDGKLKEFWEMLNWPEYIEEIFWKQNNNFLENIQLETNNQSRINIHKDLTFYKELCKQMDINDRENLTDDHISDFLKKGKSVWMKLLKEDTPVEAWPIYLKPQPISLASKPEKPPVDGLRAPGVTNLTKRTSTLATGSNSDNDRNNESKINGKSVIENKYEATRYKEEFHKKVSALSRYPHVLRVLGLIHDFKVLKKDIDDEITSSKSDFLLRFYFRLIKDKKEGETIAQEFNKSVQFVRPFTRCELNAQLSAYADEVTLTNGSIVRYKDIVDSGFIHSRYFEVNQDYFEDRSGEFTDSTNPVVKDPNVIGISGKSFTDDEIKVLRQKTNSQPKISKGFAIKIKAQPGDLLTSMDQRLEQITDDNIDSKEKAFEAHHLDCGYRVDVFDDKKNAFMSLCLRQAKYTFDDDSWINKIFGNDLFKDLKDEPWLEEVRQVDNDGNSNRFEDLARWNGWSLTCPHLNSKSETNNLSHDMELKNIKPLFLPRLRFEVKQYQFRIRTVDICGNGQPHFDSTRNQIKYPDTPPDCISPTTIAYRRFEPINPPLFFPQKDLVEELSGKDNSQKKIVKEFIGEENETLVIRTKVSTNGVADLAPIEEGCVRFLTPQFTTAHFAELLGQFEGMKNSGLYEFLKEVPKHSYAGSELKSGVPFAVDTLVSGCIADNEYYASFKPIDKTAKVEPVTLILKKDGLYGFKDSLSGSNKNIPLTTGAYKQLKIVAVKKESIYKNIDSKSAGKTFNIIHAVQRPILISGKTFDEKKVNDFFKFKKVHPLSNPGTDYRDEQKYQVQLIMDEKVLNDSPDIFPFETSNEFIISVEYNNYELNPFNKNGWSYISKDHPKETSPKDNSSTNEFSKADKFYIRKSWNNLNEATEDDKLDTVLKDNAYTKGLKDDYFNLLNHSFPDTKYREVKYTLEGISKYSSFFDMDAHDIDKKDQTPFSLKKSLTSSIENSAKPSKPNLTAILPVFTTKETAAGFEFMHDTFRVYLGNTWYETGLNEKLAVIFRKQNLTNEIEEQRNEITVLANDPTTDSTKIYLDSSKKYFPNIKGDSAINNKLFNLTIDSIATTLKLKPDELNSLINDNQHDWIELDVKWDMDQKEFYADIRFNPDTVDHYSSLLKFAVCRYQEHSISLKDKYDYRFSDVVMTDMVTVLPARTVVKINDNKYKFEGKISGTRYSKNKVPVKNVIYRISEKNKNNNEVSYLTEAEFDIKKVDFGEITFPKAEANFIEEYEDIQVEDDFKMDEPETIGYSKNGYNPRHDPTKRLVFFYRIYTNK